ncbi:MAG: regulatory protein RecX [Betaproteobacteria bacterium]|nr:regulatory protein RecX [Rubrivivax sp.]
MAPPLRSRPAGRAEGGPQPPRPAEGPTPAALKSRALRWLAQRDHSRAELERKLLTHARALARLAEAAAVAQPVAGPAGPPGPPDAPAPDSAFPDSLLRQRIAAVVDGLAAAGLMNEPRMAEALLAAKAPRLGERRLRQLMQQRGLQPALVDATVQQSRGTELERAQALWQRRFGSPGATPAERARQMRFLAGRGFGGDVIRRVVRGASDDDEPPPDESD